MDIAAMSISMSTAKVQQEVSTSLMKKTMDSAEANALNLISQMMPSTPPVSAEAGTYINMLV